MLFSQSNALRWSAICDFQSEFLRNVSTSLSSTSAAETPSICGTQSIVMLFQVKYKVRYKVLSVIQSLMQSVITKCYTKCNAKCIDVFIFWSQNIQRWTVQYFNIRRNTRTSDNCTACYDISGYKLHRVKTSLPTSDNCFHISLVTSTHCTIVVKTPAHPIKDNVEFVDTLYCCSTDIWDSS